MFWHRQPGSADEQPRAEYCANMLLKHVWPQAGKSEIAVGVDAGAEVVTVASADEQ